MSTQKSSLTAKDSNVMAVLSYFFILSIVFYIIKKDDKFVQFHAKQGIIISIIMMIGLVPILGFPFFIVAAVLSVIGASKAYIGEEYKIPFIYEYSKKIDF